MDGCETCDVGGRGIMNSDQTNTGGLNSGTFLSLVLIQHKIGFNGLFSDQPKEPKAQYDYDTASSTACQSYGLENE